MKTGVGSMFKTTVLPPGLGVSMVTKEVRTSVVMFWAKLLGPRLGIMSKRKKSNSSILQVWTRRNCSLAGVGAH